MTASRDSDRSRTLPGAPLEVQPTSTKCAPGPGPRDLDAETQGVRSAPRPEAASSLDLIASAILGILILWTYWPSFVALAERWADDPRYGHGYLIPAFSGFLIWRRRREFGRARSTPPEGPILLAIGLVLRLAGTRAYFEWLETISLLPTLAGAIAILGGRPALKASWLAIAFLGFMVPLPHRVEQALSGSLQRASAVISVYTLQVFGLETWREGNIIRIGEHRLGVEDACSGLGLLFTLIAMGAGAAILVSRPRVDRTVLVLSAIPIALLANWMRITATGLMSEWVGHGRELTTYHDLAGWLMMPTALGLFWAELKLLSALLPAAEAADPAGVEPGPKTCGEDR